MARTLLENATYINSTIKPAIKSAIIAQGVSVSDSDSFLDYATKIGQISGSGVDTSKIDFSIGSNATPSITDGRILQGFASMTGYHARPLDALGNWLDVDWSNDFEIGVAFKFIGSAFPQLASITGVGRANEWRQAPRISYDKINTPDGKLHLCISTDGSTLAINEWLNFVLTLNKWYFIKLKFVLSTMTFTVDISDDFTTFTSLYNNTMSAAPYHDTASLCFGGDAQNASNASNSLLIDIYNTYIKDDSGNIVWGAFSSAFPS